MNNLDIGVIFDLDGVIADTSQYHAKAWSDLASFIGIECPCAAIAETKGLDRMSSLKLVLSHASREFNVDELEYLADLKNSYYLQYIEGISPNNLLPGVKSALDYMKSSGLKLAIGSSSKNANLVIERLEIKSYFDSIVDGSMVTKLKPEPDVFLLAAKLIGMVPSKCIVIEDSAVGVQAAICADMKVAFINSDGIIDNKYKPNIVIPSLKYYKGFVNKLIKFEL